MKKWAKIITLSSIVVLASASAQMVYADTNASQNETAITAVSPNTGTTTAPSNATTVPVVAPNAGTTIPSSDTTVPAVAPNAGTTTIPSSDTTVPAVAPNTGTTTIPSSDTTVPAVSPNTGTTTAPSSDTTVPSVPTSPSEQPSVVAPTDPGTTVATGSSSAASSSSSSSTTTTTATTPTSEDKNKKDNATSDNKVSVPTIDGGTTTLIPDVKVPTNNPGVSAQTAVEAGASQVGTTSQVTGQVVQEVSPSAPVQTETGASIVSTQNGNVVLSDGSVVAPEAVGGTVNEDKTISVTDKDGKLKTLPNTGLKESILLTFAGFGLLAIVVSFFLKKRSN